MVYSGPHDETGIRGAHQFTAFLFGLPFNDTVNCNILLVLASLCCGTSTFLWDPIDVPVGAVEVSNEIVFDFDVLIESLLAPQAFYFI